MSALALNPVPDAEGRQCLSFKCECGLKPGQYYLKHYEVCRCQCGRFFWALQPKRSGPLKAFIWPGRNP
jgi:hypothetical protein